MSNITIPPAALEAGARVIWPQWDETDMWAMQLAKNKARAACLAMLRAWPGMTHMEPDLANGIIILPLTQEASDDKA